MFLSVCVKRTKCFFLSGTLLLVLALTTPFAQAAQVQRVLPSGSVSKVQQVQVDFVNPVVPIGKPDAPDPATLQCEGLQVQGQGRWLNEKSWVYNLTKEIPAGFRCAVLPKPSFRSLTGTAIKGFTEHKFDTGGPVLLHILPDSWEKIDEQQHFIVSTAGIANKESVLANVWCEASDVGERIPVRLLNEAERKIALADLWIEEEAEKKLDDFLGITCQRRFTSGAEVNLVWGKGVASSTGVIVKNSQKKTYNVRQAFKASFSCERENAKKKCNPSLPMEVKFNADINSRWLAKIRLVSGDREWRAEATSKKSEEPTLEQDSQSEGETTDSENLVDRVFFQGPFPEATQFTLELPPDLEDDAGRRLSNAGAFPLRVSTDLASPLAKFASDEFAIIERFAEGRDAPALLPVTLRRVESDLPIRILRIDDDKAILHWMQRMRFVKPEYNVSRKDASFAGAGPWLDIREKDVEEKDRWSYDGARRARNLSLLNSQPQAKTLTIPAPKSDVQRKETEVVGIPLEPGYQVVEIASPILGASLIEDVYVSPPVLYARTAALVTNLAVHFKNSPEGAMAWVTSLDVGKPIAKAKVKVYSCLAELLAEADTDSSGIALFPAFDAELAKCGETGNYRQAYMVTARSSDGDDLGLVWSDWDDGIEPWRFNLSLNMWEEDAYKPTVHTLTDRALLRAGEKVSFKHYLRKKLSNGLVAPDENPIEMKVQHIGSEQKYTQPLNWQKNALGGLSAENSFKLPILAPLGRYQVSLVWLDGKSQPSGSFRVEEFRLPVMEGSLVPVGDGTLVHADKLDMNMQLNYVSGGGASDWPVAISALLESSQINFADYPDYDFSSPLSMEDRRSLEMGGYSGVQRQILLEKKPFKLDKQGNVRFKLDGLTRSTKSQTLRTEVTYADPNGEMQTLSNSRTIWPAEVLVGLKTEHWISVKNPLKVYAQVLTPQGTPVAGVKVTVQGYMHTTLSTRKRMVGGVYKYDHQYQSKDLGTFCNGESDSYGRIECTVNLKHAGEVELVASVQDKQQRSHASATSVWVSSGQVWFDAQASDRIDVLPEKRDYKTGETAHFQVRMPFRRATALVTVENKGIVESQVMELSGDDPSFNLKIGKDWRSTMAVSVLVVRGRVKEVPWYSFFTWGFKSPVVWWHAWRNDNGDEEIPPSALVDLSKPAYRMGVASINVEDEAHQIKVNVAADKPKYATGETAQLQIQAQLPNGKPAAEAEVAIAVVDKALLELAPNTSWDLFKAMRHNSSWLVRTATAQMEVLGRRHYGRKAVAAGGGGGGEGATRELFDTLVYWNPRVKLDDKGRAVVKVPLNDSVTTFHAQVIADAGVDFFGGGSTEIQVAQDVQIIGGLPPVLREGDEFDAEFIIRNTTKQPVNMMVNATLAGQALESRTVEIAAGAAQAVRWRVTAPLLIADQLQSTWQWDVKASSATASDSIKLTQTILPAVPVTTRQASLRQLDGFLNLQVGMPTGAIEGRGGLQIEAQSTLYEDMPNVIKWWQNYPYACLEQRYSKSIGLMDESLWANLTEDLPGYLDGDGLVSYFPISSSNNPSGSATLTAHLLAADATMRTLSGMEKFRLNDAIRDAMIHGLSEYVMGRKNRKEFNQSEYGKMYKLSAIAALAQNGAATPNMLESMSFQTLHLPTHTLLDWLQILQKVPNIPGRQKHLSNVQAELRARLVQTGTQVLFNTESTDDWWWVMQSGDVNVARLLLIAAAMPEWKSDMAGLATGLIARQRYGRWGTSVSNFWGVLALKRFSELHESEAVTGDLRASLGGDIQSKNWNTQTVDASSGIAQRKNKAAEKLLMNFAWPDAIARAGDPLSASRLSIEQIGSGKPWVSISSLAAVPTDAPITSGLQVTKAITPILQSKSGQWSKGDIYRVRLEVKSNVLVGMSALTDPIPAGSTILGSGLGRDSSLATEGEKVLYEEAYVERKMDLMRVYYYYLPAGVTSYEYTVRLNQPGEFYLPPTRVEALYASQVFAETPNERFSISKLVE